MKIFTVFLLMFTVTGCVTLRDPRDAPWDPPAGRQLFDQIPNWESAAGRICGGHLSREQRIKESRSSRC